MFIGSRMWICDHCSTSINSLDFRANYSVTSNNMKFVRWPLMGMFNGLLHLLRPTHQRPVYQSPYCCIMVRCSAVLMCPWRVNIRQIWFLRASLYFSKRGAYWDRLCRDVVGRWSLVIGWLVGWLVVTRVHCGQTVHPRPIVTMEH